MIKSGVLQIIFAYQKILSPLLGARCRFYPTCSEYLGISLEKHSLAMGLWLTFKRLMRCHPYCEGGFDPVP